MTINQVRQALAANQLGKAAEICRSMLVGEPANLEIHYNLALILARTGEMAEAVKHFQRCASAAPDNAEILNNLGNAQRLSGQMEDARSSLDRALRLAPRHPGVLCNRGWLKLEGGHVDAALEDFRASADAAGRWAEPRRGVGECLLLKEDWPAACATLLQAVELEPKNAAYLNSLGVAHVRQGQVESALPWFEKALAQQPDHPDALLNHGICCEQLGKLEQAERSLKRAIKVSPGRGAAHFHLAHLSIHRSTEEEIALMERAWSTQGDTNERIDLGFALGKAFDQRRHYDRAFHYFTEARKLKQAREPYHHDRERKRARHILAVTEGLSPGLTREVPRPIFVVGMPRSGTTLAEQILASHPLVHAIGESGLVGGLLREAQGITRRTFPECLPALEQADRERLTEAFFESVAMPKDHSHFVDTTPGNFMYAGVLSRMFPGARLVHCVRSPQDTCLSIFQQPLSAAHAYANSLETLGDYYRLYQEVMQEWEAMSGVALYRLEYETLVAEPENTVAALLEFCGLPYDDGCLKFHKTSRAVKTPSAAQVRQPLFNSSVGRWQGYEPYLQPLLQRLSG